MKRTTKPKKKKRKIPKQAVHHDALKGIKQRIGSDEWVQDSVELDQDMEASANNEILYTLFMELTSGLTIYQKDEKLRDLNILIVNLISNKNKAVSIPMNRNYWADEEQRKFNKASPFIIELIKLLKQKNYINMAIGYINEKESRNTRIWSTDKLLDICQKLPEWIITTPPKEPILLKDWDKKGKNGKKIKAKLKPYKDTRFTLGLRKTIQRVNKINNDADIRIDGFQLSVFLRAIFKGDFNHGGRLYSYGHRHFQGFTGEERAGFTINGDPVIEYDFSALHPHLLYAMEGIQLECDPYLAVINDPKLRDFMKLTLLRMINGRSKEDVIKNINYEMNFLERQNKTILNNAGIEDARELVNKFMDAHRPIDKYLCQGEQHGLRVFNKDARITYDIIKHFATREIPILPVHDSFIVQQKFGDQLKHHMRHIYNKKTRGFNCPVKSN